MLNLIITPKQAEDIGASFAQGFTNEWSKITSEESIHTLAQNIYSGLKDKETDDQSTSPLFAGLGDGVGKALGDEVNSGYDVFMNKLNPSEKTSSIMQEVNKGLDSGLDELVRSTTLKIQGSLKNLRETTSEEIRLLQADAQKMFRESTLAALPWIALTAAVAVGVPLLVLYVYHRAKRDMEQEEVIRKKTTMFVPRIIKPYGPIL